MRERCLQSSRLTRDGIRSLCTARKRSAKQGQLLSCDGIVDEFADGIPNVNKATKLPAEIDDPREALFARAAASAALKEKLEAVSAGKTVCFEHVTASAQPFLVALLAKHTRQPGGRIWVVCDTERSQERFHAELSNWFGDALIFPHLEVAAVEGALPDPETSAERLAVIQRLASKDGALVVLNQHSFAEQVPALGAVQKSTLELEPGIRLDREKLIEQLAAAGYESVSQISDRGQFSVRGGVMDLYSWQQALPSRMEWFDDEIETIREFELDQQVSVRAVNRCSVMLNAPENSKHTLSSYRKKSDLLIGVEINDQDYAIRIGAGTLKAAEGVEEHAAAFYASPLEVDPQALHTPAIHEATQTRVKGQLRSWEEDGVFLGIQCRKNSDRTEIEKLLSDLTLSSQNTIYWGSENVVGFTFPSAKIAVSSGVELLGYNQTGNSQHTSGSRKRRGLLRQRSQIDFTEFKEGELIVHLEHGVGRFLGVEAKAAAGAANSGRGEESEEMMVLEFAHASKLFVPLDQAFLVTRYVGLGKRHVTLSELGDGKWASTKKTAEKSIYDYAAKLLKVQAARETHPGIVFSPDNQWQKEFENAFPYRETADQITAIGDTKDDMESGRAMDRLICGDVGFGKTEVAIRAAFKAAMSGKQVAMMVPTTVLAQQHYENFSGRMANYPVTVELLSRYRSHADQSRVAGGLNDGSVDIVIGTHRLISRDVEFKDLGLLIVDEEQRFGVRHKERIKERFPNVDVLTLSATPIPRTLYMALTGARDLSTLETPPPNRYPVETNICAYDERIIRDAVDRELDRQGQVYFLHNRVEDIERVRSRIKQLCPRARVDLGHGQMEEGQLEEVMHRFVNGETDVLVATTIIESGLDIPNANTIIIDRADRFGLADLYQLRGRVGRGQHKAYAYLMLPRDLLTVGEARKRINAIKQYSNLGAGFKIALRDLEIRGAGNILGLAQSGHLTAIGFDLYCQLLKQAVGKLKGEKNRQRVEVITHLDFVATTEAEYRRYAQDIEARTPVVTPVDKEPTEQPLQADERWPAFLPASYIEEAKLRIQAYRQIAGVSRLEELESLRANWRDRFGRLPEAAKNLLELTRIKLIAAGRRVQQIEVRGAKVMLTRGGDYVLVAGKFPRLTSRKPVSKVREIHALLEAL